MKKMFLILGCLIVVSSLFAQIGIMEAYDDLAICAGQGINLRKKSDLRYNAIDSRCLLYQNNRYKRAY
jgi:hypothetical protein